MIHIKSNKKLIKSLFKSVFFVSCLMVLVGCKSGNLASQNSGEESSINHPNQRLNQDSLPYHQDERRNSKLPIGQDAEGHSKVPNGQDEGSHSELPNGQDPNVYQFSLTQPAQQKVDFLMVVDKSLSMQNNHKNKVVGSRFGDMFSGPLQSVDWQMIFIDTYVDSSYNAVEYLEDNQGRITKTGGGDLQLLNLSLNALHNLVDIFTSTIYQGSQVENRKYDTEEPLNNIIKTIQLPENNKFFRADAALVALIISDEDELSTGGSKATKPTKVMQTVKSIFGQSKQFFTYGVIIQPGDRQCLNAERKATVKIDQMPPDSDPDDPCPPGHSVYTDNQGGSYGYSISELAHLTGGTTTSICNEDYSAIMAHIQKTFTANRITNEIKLRHTNVLENSISVTFTPSTNAPSWQLNAQGDAITLSAPPAEGTQVSISYKIR